MRATRKAPPAQRWHESRGVRRRHRPAVHVCRRPRPAGGQGRSLGHLAGEMEHGEQEETDAYSSYISRSPLDSRITETFAFYAIGPPLGNRAPPRLFRCIGLLSSVSASNIRHRPWVPPFVPPVAAAFIGTACLGVEIPLPPGGAVLFALVVRPSDGRLPRGRRGHDRHVRPAARGGNPA